MSPLFLFIFLNKCLAKDWSPENLRCEKWKRDKQLLFLSFGAAKLSNARAFNTKYWGGQGAQRPCFNTHALQIIGAARARFRRSWKEPLKVVYQEFPKRSLRLRFYKEPFFLSGESYPLRFLTEYARLFVEPQVWIIGKITKLCKIWWFQIYTFSKIMFRFNGIGYPVKYQIPLAWQSIVLLSCLH